MPDVHDRWELSMGLGRSFCAGQTDRRSHAEPTSQSREVPIVVYRHGAEMYSHSQGRDGSLVSEGWVRASHGSSGPTYAIEAESNLVENFGSVTSVAEPCNHAQLP